MTALLLSFGLTHGSLPIPASAIGRALFYPESLPADARYIVMDIRLPRLLMAVLCGAMLGMAGAAMQSITRNGLADPGLIGVKEGCSAAVLLLIFQFPALSLFWRPLVGMVGGLLTALLVVALARDISRPRFILIGIGVSWAFAAAMGVFMTTADVRDVQTAMLWLAGSLHTANWTLVGVAAGWAVPACALLLFTARAADVALLGNQAATGWGAYVTAGAAAPSRPGGADGGLRLLRGQYWVCRIDCAAYGAPCYAAGKPHCFWGAPCWAHCWC
jgi:iron complex transport system permease protein